MTVKFFKVAVFCLQILIITNLFALPGLEARIVVKDVRGYQNPHERDGDLRRVDKNAKQGRNQKISGRWPKSGVVIFYSSLFHDPREVCLIRQSVSVIAKYACMPINAVEISRKCARSNTLRCILDSQPGEGDLDPVGQMRKRQVNERSVRDYILLENKEPGCNSDIGRIGHKQTINYNSTCFSSGVGTLIHEMMHALGYGHEHTRFDRDQHIIINRTNIKSGHKFNFEKGSKEEFKDYGPYDFNSLMHYSSYAFAKDRTYHTITTKDNPEHFYYQIGQRDVLTLSDKAKIRSVTHCAGSTYKQHTEEIKKIDFDEDDTNLTTYSLPCDMQRRIIKQPFKS